MKQGWEEDRTGAEHSELYALLCAFSPSTNYLVPLHSSPLIGRISKTSCLKKHEGGGASWKKPLACVISRRGAYMDRI